MLTIRIPELGQVSVLLDTLNYEKGHYTMRCANINGTISCTKISWQEDYVYEYGWVRVVAYTINGITTPCDHLTSIG